MNSAEIRGYKSVQKGIGRIISLYLCTSIPLYLILFSCGGNTNHPGKKDVDPKQFKLALEKVNKYEVQKESDEINQYIARHGWAMARTGTGLRYLKVKKGNGSMPGSGDFVTVNYRISLLDGTECYSSAKEGPKEFKVEGDNVESGLHEAVLLMNTGDEAKFILPSYMANGLRGDNGRIPPLSALVVDIELLSVH